jgi:signal transduction histidine kinase
MLTGSDGRKWEVRCFPLRASESKVERVIVMATDITEKIRLEEEAAVANRLTSLGVLAAGIAHEINNPNGLILLHLSMLQKCFEELLPVLDQHMAGEDDLRVAGLPYPRLQAEIPRIFQVSLESARRIKQIVEDLKNFSSEKPMNLVESVDINQSVETAVRLTRHAVIKATDRFEVNYGADLPPVKGNSRRIEQLVVNLVMNACEALPDSSRSIAITTGKDADAHCNFIRIEDEGIGMSPEVMHHALDPFYTTRRDKGGTGLGLSISSRIVKEHGGRIAFDSIPGAGTGVTVFLPFTGERDS